MCHNKVPTTPVSELSSCQVSGSLNRVETKEAAASRSKLVLLLVGGRYTSLETLLQRRGYLVIVPGSPDHAVAICLHNQIVSALIDEEFLADADSWSIAESLKAVCPNISIVLLIRGSAAKGYPLRGVDYIVNDSEPQQVLNALRKRVSR